MAWAKLDDGMHSHPKFMAVSLGAAGLWAIGLSYAADYLTDGLVPRPVALGRDDRAEEYAAELVTAGLWDEHERGWMIHNYLEFNPSRAEVEGAREERSAKAKAAAEKRWASKKQSESQAERNAPSNATSMPSAGQHASSTHRHVYAPDPTRPDLSSTDVETDDPRERAVVVIPPPPAVSEETNRVCDTLAAAGLNVHDRTAMESLLAEFPEVDAVEAAVTCANWVRGKRARYPLPTLRKFLEADDAKKRRVVDPALARYANVGTVDDGSGS